MMLQPSLLAGKTLKLVPISEDAIPEFTARALSAPEVWTHIPWPMQTESSIARTFREALQRQARGDSICFGTRLASTGELIGGTSIFRVEGSFPAAHVGGTWILPPFQRTRVNTEAKFLQFQHCFAELGCKRVHLQTDVRNLRSQTAIARLGAQREGVLRAHMFRRDGSLRDSVLYSILASEWPAVRERLLGWLARD